MLVVTWRREYVGSHMEEGICWWSDGEGSMLVVTWRREYVGGHFQEGICWWSLGGGNMLVVTWRREYVGGPMEEGIYWWSPWKGRGICWDCGKILVSYYAQCEKNFCKKNPPPPLSFFWLDVLGDPGRGGRVYFGDHCEGKIFWGPLTRGICWWYAGTVEYYCHIMHNVKRISAKKNLSPPTHTTQYSKNFFLKI